MAAAVSQPSRGAVAVHCNAGRNRCVCVCVCVCDCVCVCMYTCMFTYTRACLHIHVHVCVYTCTCMYIHVYVYIYTCVFTYTHACLRTHTHTHTPSFVAHRRSSSLILSFGVEHQGLRVAPLHKVLEDGRGKPVCFTTEWQKVVMELEVLRFPHRPSSMPTWQGAIVWGKNGVLGPASRGGGRAHHPPPFILDVDASTSDKAEVVAAIERRDRVVVLRNALMPGDRGFELIDEPCTYDAMVATLSYASQSGTVGHLLGGGERESLASLCSARGWDTRSVLRGEVLPSK
jgi:hypothetical protein